MTMGFGDTHPGKLNPAIFARMVTNAQKHGKKDQERQFTAKMCIRDRIRRAGCGWAREEPFLCMIGLMEYLNRMFFRNMFCHILKVRCV